jgi:hypothetical protein
MSRVVPYEAVGRVEGRGDECGEEQEADEMGVGSSDEIGHDGERDELEESEGGGLPCNRNSILLWRYECPECPCGAPGEPAKDSQRLKGGRERKNRTHSGLKGTLAVVFAIMSRRRVRNAANTLHAINVQAMTQSL